MRDWSQPEERQRIAVVGALLAAVLVRIPKTTASAPSDTAPEPREPVAA